MSKKSRKVASRQAQLSGRAKRTRHHRPNVASHVIESPIVQENDTTDDSSLQEEAVITSQSKPRDTPYVKGTQSTSVLPNRSRGRFPQAAPIEEYFGPELRRIGLVTVLIVGIMIVLVFALG